MTDDRLAGVDEVQIATLDRCLRLQLAAPPSGLGKDRRPMADHRQRSAGAFEVLDDRVPDGLAGLRPLERSCLLAVALDRVGGRSDGRRQLLRAQLAAPHGIDATDGALERLVDAGRQLPDGRSEVLDLPGPCHDPAGPAQDDEDTECQRGEGRDRQEDRELTHAQQAPSRQPERVRSWASSAFPTSTRSPITIMSAKSAIGASGSRLTAMIVDAVCMPTLCWI